MSAPAPNWRENLAESGRQRFEALGLPSTKAEAWRYFPTRSLARFDLASAAPAPPEVSRAHVDALAVAATLGRAVFVNGVYAPGLSDLSRVVAAGAVATNLASALTTCPEQVQPHLGTVASSPTEGLLAANDAYFQDGFCLVLPEGVVLDAPVEVLMLGGVEASGRASHPRHLMVLGRFAEATVVVRYLGETDASYATNAVTEVIVGENAKLHHVKVCDEGDAGVHVSTIDARLAKDAGLRSFVLSLGGERARTALRVTLAGQGAECQLDGLYVAAGDQRLDHFTEVDHAAPHTSSNELYAGIMSGTSVGTFQGVVKIAEGATKCETHQLNRNLLLSQGATANTKPQLEIDNDDVKATHGATVGQLDKAALFYLVSRGIAPDAAKGMLTFAFAKEVLGRLGIAAVEDAVLADVAARFGAEVPHA